VKNNIIEERIRKDRQTDGHIYIHAQQESCGRGWNNCF